MVRMWFIVVPLVAIAACSQAPEYVRPALPVANQWPDSPVSRGEISVPAGPANGNAPASSQKIDISQMRLKLDKQVAWRAVFPDDYLQSLIDQALAHNRDLAIAVFRVDEARALAGIAGAARLPSLDFAAFHEARGYSTNSARTSSQTTSQRYDINIAVPAFELDFWGRVKNLDDAARANFLASEYAREAFRLILIRDVAQAWFSVIELKQRWILAEQTVSSREEALILVMRRRDAGLVDDIDFHQATGALANARAEVAILARQYAAAESGLQLLLGAEVPKQVILQNGMSLTLLQSTTGNGVVQVRDVTVGLPSEVLLNRPDILAAEQKLIAANANVGAARAAFFPRITLTTTAGSASSALSDLFTAGSGVWSFVPAIAVPLFDGGRNQDNLDIAEARKNIAIAEYEKAIQTAFREIASLLAARTHYVNQIQSLQIGSDAQLERLRLVDARYAAGVTDHLQLLEAQRDSFVTQQVLLIAKQQALSTSAALYAALGNF
ncbi:MAG: efflux transporter outer membrane subunit [Rhodocyclaceae bacterium]|nr:efflux transporter outer membrane subunit [Rhodocyclaceae bacterium]